MRSSVPERMLMFVSGIMIGVGAALLFAPEPGVKVRRRLSRHARRYAREAKEELLEQGAQLWEKGRELVDAAKEQGKEFLETKAEDIKGTAQKTTRSAK
jgi:gas vesicle protein